MLVAELRVVPAVVVPRADGRPPGQVLAVPGVVDQTILLLPVPVPWVAK